MQVVLLILAVSVSERKRSDPQVQTSPSPKIHFVINHSPSHKKKVIYQIVKEFWFLYTIQFSLVKIAQF